MIELIGRYTSLRRLGQCGVKINAEQQAELKEIVDRRAQGEHRLYAEMWSHQEYA